jgi:cysteine-rich repeat protein
MRRRCDAAVVVFCSLSAAACNRAPSEQEESGTGTSESGATTEASTGDLAASSESTSSDVSVCGNGVLEPGEECDDGNIIDGDGCSSTCEITMPTARSVVAGSCTCALLSEGRLRCWGASECNGWGGDWPFPIGLAETPATHGDLPIDFRIESMALQGIGCVITDEATVRCWGASAPCYNHLCGYLGLGEPAWDVFRLRETRDAEVGGPVEQVAVGAAHVCAILEGGRLRCWGLNDYGQLGYGHTENIGDDETPASVGDVDVGGPVLQVALGTAHTCALLDGGDVRCWGWGKHPRVSAAGFLGRGDLETIGDDEVPSSVDPVDLGGRAVQISAGTLHTCARLDTGEVVCWGYGDSGRLGYGNVDNVGDDETPAEVGPVDVGAPVLAVELGHTFTCVLLAEGRVKCWGSGAKGQLGYGNEDDIGDDEMPASVGTVDIGGPVLAISAGSTHTCVLLPEHRIRCWGWNLSGRLGYPNTEHVGAQDVPADAGDVLYE